MEALVYAVLGIVVSLLASVAKQANWSPKTSQSVVAFLSAVGGVVTSYFNQNGTVELNNTLQSSAVLLAVAQLVYAYGLKDSRLNKFLVGLNLGAPFNKSKTPAQIEEELALALVEQLKKAKAAQPKSSAAGKTVARKKTTKKKVAE